MRFIIGFCIFSCVVNVISSSEIEKKKNELGVDQKQEKRSLSHDEWSGQGIGYDLPVTAIETGSVLPAASVGVSTHTDTLTTVREKVPVPVDRPVPFPVVRTVPVEIVKNIPAPYPVPQPYPVIKNVPQPYPVEVIKHIDRPV